MDQPAPSWPACHPARKPPDPDTYYLFWSSTTAKGPGQINLNFSQYKSQKIDELLDTAGRTLTSPRARRLQRHRP